MGSIGIRFNRALILAVVLLMSVFGPCEGKRYAEPENCKRLECAQYEVVHSRKEYEIRSYKMATWVATSPINSASYMDAVSQGFNTLFAYIQGNNNENTKLNMTAPVLVDISPSSNGNGSGNPAFVVHFYLPHKYQAHPPQSKQAHPVKLPNHRYAAVRRFGGFMNDSNIPTQVSALQRSLIGTPWGSPRGRASGNVVPVPYSVAGYNSPYEYSNRVNEVILWFDKY